MPILNSFYWGGSSWWWGNIWEPLNLTVTSAWLDATITWEDNEIWTIPPTTFAKSELVRKIGSAPTSPSDWDLVVTETVKDTYKVSGYTDSWLTDWTTYYYRVFSYSDLWWISYCDAVSVTIQPITIQTYDFQNDWLLWWSQKAGSALFGYDSWEWISIQRQAGFSVWWCDIQPSNDVYISDKTISKITIWLYKPTAYRCIWIRSWYGGTNPKVFRYQIWPSYANQIWFDGTSSYQTVWAFTGEIKLEMNITSSWVSGIINWVSYNVADSYANWILTDYANNNLTFNGDIWQSQDWKTYIRKIEIVYE